jgi:hypothetical protein
MGFAREGNIPGFYKRSDAFVLGAMVPPNDSGDDLEQSGLRPAYTADGAEDTETERLYQHARKVAKDREALPPFVAKVQPARPADVQKAVAAAVKSGRALTAFEPFGRDVQRAHYLCTARGGLSLVASVEMQTCFNNAFLEILTAPRTDKEQGLVSAALRQLCDDLFEREVVGCFALSPTEDTDLGAIYLNNGFRKTGVLRRHLWVARRRVDAFLWSRKLAQPSDG